MDSDSDTSSDDVSTTSQLTSSSRGTSSLRAQQPTSSSSNTQQNRSSRWMKDSRKPGTRRRNSRRKNVPYSPSDQTISLTSQDATSPSMSTGARNNITTDTSSELSTFSKTNTLRGYSDGELLSSKRKTDSENTFESTERFRNQRENTPTSLRTRTSLPTTLSASTKTQSNFQTSLSTSEETVGKTPTFSATGETDSGDTNSKYQRNSSKQFTSGSQSISVATSTGDKWQKSLEVSSNLSDTIEPRHSISRQNNRSASSRINNSQQSQASSGSRTNQQSKETGRGTSANSQSRTRNSGIMEGIVHPRKGILHKKGRPSAERNYMQPYIRGIPPSESDREQSYRLTDGKPRFQGELPQRISAGRERRKILNQIVPDDNLAYENKQIRDLNIHKARKSSQQKLAENLERTNPPQVSAQVNHCFFPEESLNCDEPCGYGGCDPCGEDGYSDCDARDKADVRFMRAKMIKLEDTLELMYKKFKLHEDNIDEMQERLYLYEYGTPGTFLAVVRFYFAILTCTVVPLLIVEAFYRLVFGFK